MHGVLVMACGTLSPQDAEALTQDFAREPSRASGRAPGAPGGDHKEILAFLDSASLCWWCGRHCRSRVCDGTPAKGTITALPPAEPSSVSTSTLELIFRGHQRSGQCGPGSSQARSQARTRSEWGPVPIQL